MTKPNQKPAGSIKTSWSLRTYDVWGNATDGYEVNDTYPAGEIELRIPQTRSNVGTEQEFVSASPTDQQIRDAFGIEGKPEIDTDGDDLTVYVNRSRDGYPIGEMHCTSHASLSPVRSLPSYQFVTLSDGRNVGIIGRELLTFRTARKALGVSVRSVWTTRKPETVNAFVGGAR